MYPAYSDMIAAVYNNYYNEDGQPKPQRKAAREDIYYYLTSEPPEQGNRYFGAVAPPLKQQFQKIINNKVITWGNSQYYMIDPCNEPPEGPFLTARTVANIYSQETALKIACQLYDFCKSKKYPNLTQTIYLYKIFLGDSTNNKPVKLDKIVIYNRISLSQKGKFTPISQILAQQISYLSRFCAKGAQLPQFVWTPSSYSPVGFGEGIAYNGQDMTFSEPRADCVYKVIQKAGRNMLSLEQFQDLLSIEFKRHGLSPNIPFINNCNRNAERKWVLPKETIKQ